MTATELDALIRWACILGLLFVAAVCIHAAVRAIRQHRRDTITAAAVALTDVCACLPCPGRGNDGHGMTHCAECCWGTGVEADLDCPIHGDPRYRPVALTERDIAEHVLLLQGQAEMDAAWDAICEAAVIENRALASLAAVEAGRAEPTVPENWSNA